MAVGTVLYPRPVHGAQGVEEATVWHAYYDKDRDVYYHNSVTGVTQVIDLFFLIRFYIYIYKGQRNAGN